MQLDYLKGKRIVLTGGTSGIGYAFLEHVILYKPKFTLLVRDLKNGEITIDRLRLLDPEVDIELIKYDQTDFSSIEKALDEVNKRYPDFDFLVLNAGVLKPKKDMKITNDYEPTIGINYFANKHFIEYLSKINNKKHRVIVQGSIVAHHKLPKNLDVHNKKYNYFQTYNISKALIESQIYHYVKHNKYPNLEFVVTEPGIGPTRVIRNFPRLIRFLGKYFLMLFNVPKVASLPLVEAIKEDTKNGDYFVPKYLFTLKGKPVKKEFPEKRYQYHPLLDEKEI